MRFERRQRDNINEKISEPATLCMLDIGGESLFFFWGWCDFLPPLWVEPLVGLRCLFPSSILTKPEPELTPLPKAQMETPTPLPH
jgi:hypothetical protein